MREKRGMNLWLDDVRRPPMDEPWVWVQNLTDAKTILEAITVEFASLDHDLGTETGYELCLWMAETGHWPRTRPVVHSMNPPGAERMRGVIERYWTLETTP